MSKRQNHYCCRSFVQDGMFLGALRFYMKRFIGRRLKIIKDKANELKRTGSVRIQSNLKGLRPTQIYLIICY